MNLKKIVKLFTGKFVGTGPSSYEKRIYRAAVSQRLRNTGLNSMEKGRVSPFIFFLCIQHLPDDGGPSTAETCCM
jgi:hypothetical protein